MPRFTDEQAEQFVAFSVFVQRVDRAGGSAREGGITYWQVVDRITPKVNNTAVTGDFETEEDADRKCAELREKHLPRVKAMV